MIVYVLGRDFTAKLVDPPTRAETIKEVWAEARDHWNREQICGRLIVEHDLGIVPEILFEQRQYGNFWVIEAEGVVVERLESK